MINKSIEIEKTDYVTGTKWHVFYYAEVTGSRWINEAETFIYCGGRMVDTEDAANEAGRAWLEIGHDDDDLAIKLTDGYFDYDPYNGADYGECLQGVLEGLQTPEGMKQLLIEQLEMLHESIQ